jgi:predicted HTH transcriptional regulator|tara:strand:- start:218 stop:520 length:303 start_codon:yes stop_codon:yes gene_type:complete
MGYNKEGIGYQSTDTSREAASYNKKGKLRIKDEVKSLFGRNVMMTTEEVSRALSRPEISVQPRISELKNDGYLRDSGNRRKGKWGTHIIVWERVPVWSET